MGGWVKKRHLLRVIVIHCDWALPRLEQKPRVAVVVRAPHAEVVLVILQPQHQSSGTR